MSNLQRATQTPAQPTLIQSSPPASSFNPRDPGRAPQTTGVNVPDAALGGTPYTAVDQGNGRTDFVSPSTGLTDALNKDGPVPIKREISPRDDRGIDRLVQNEQGTTNRDILNTPDSYHDAVVGRNYIEGGGVNGMSPTALAQRATPGSKPTAETPSVGRESGISKILTEDAGDRYWTGDKANQGSTAMRANSTLTAGKKPGPIVPLSGEYAPYTPAELRKGGVPAAKPEAPAAQPAATASAPAQANPQMDKIRAVIRRQETGSFDGDYGKQNTGGKTSASGAYQFVDKTWRNAARDAGVGTEYKRAYQAPKSVQDQVFDHYFGRLMDRTKGDVYKAINIHFTGNPEGRLSDAGKKANPTINAQGYRKSIQNHEAEYDRLKNQIARR